ncbi:MAG: S41 family peptidase, partial [Bacteroidota bacterium]
MLYKDCPAHKAGVYVGDTIIRVNGEDMAAQPLDHISSLLKGMPSTQVQLTVVRQGVEQPITLTLTREKVNLKNVPYFGKVQDEIGYIRLANFATHAADEVQAALKSLQERGAQKLILDLRGNPGGILEEAIKVVNLFIDEGLTVVATKGKIASWAKTYTTTQSAYDSHLPVIVLIDQKSASAAEIVAGVIQDYDRGLLMGKSTFGKGLVQSTRSLSYNTQLKLTTARYYLPSGRSIQKIDYRQQKGTEQTVQEEQEVRSVFTTQAGRIVYEQEGVAPDIGGEKWRWAPITISLIEKGLVFEYATHFQAQNSHIAPASKFALSDAQYQDFVTWLQDKDYPYTIEQ